jgi:hypothetical protein
MPYSTKGAAIAAIVLSVVVVAARVIGKRLKNLKWSISFAALGFLVYNGIQASLVYLLGIRSGRDAPYFFLIHLVGLMLVPGVVIVSTLRNRREEKPFFHDLNI